MVEFNTGKFLKLHPLNWLARHLSDCNEGECNKNQTSVKFA